MRLIRIEVVGKYKSIGGTADNPFSYDFQENSSDYSPLCLVGLNGSGKSNFIELIADIFGYADRYFNPQYQCEEDLPYNFVLDYKLNYGGGIKFIKLKCFDSKLKMYTYNDISYLDFLSVNYKSPNLSASLVNVSEVDCDFHDLLPKKIIAYSSGHNQGLSSVFAKTQYSLFDVVRKQGVFYREYTKKVNNLKGRSFDEDDAIIRDLSSYIERTYLSNPSLFHSLPGFDLNYNESYMEYGAPIESKQPNLPIGIFTDHAVNQLIFISLIVNQNQSFQNFLSEYIGVNELISFEIDFRLADYRNLDFIKDEVVNRLCELSSNSSRFNDKTLTGILEFKLDNKFFERIESLYLDRSLFFEKLLFIHQMVAKRWSRDEKRMLKTSKFEKNVPNISGGLTPIRFVNTKVKLAGINELTLYDRLSDGEHQLIQIVGSLMLFDKQESLFILDEPESHFNPEWRIEFIELLNQYVDLNNLELMISTHSPFLLSACKSKRVLHFKKDEQKNISISSPDIETYGSSFDSLLNSIFDLDVLISKKPLADIRGVLKNYDDGKISESDVLKQLESYGESFELNYRRNKIRLAMSSNYKDKS